MDKSDKQQFVINLQTLNTYQAVEKYYNLELYQKGSASYTYTPAEEVKIHIKLLVDEFISQKYVDEDCESKYKPSYNMKAKLKSLCADGRPEKRRNSHQYQEFANWVESQKWYHKWNLMMNGGEDTTRGEKLANKQYRLENEKLKAQNSKLRNENLDLKEKHRVLKNSNAGLRKQLQQNQQNVTIDETKNVERVIESEPEPEPEPTHIQEPEPVKKKRPIPPQALLPEECLIESSDSDSESSDEEEVEQPEKELVFNYDNPYPVIKWEDIEHRDMEKTLRDACSDYCDILRNTYVEEVKHKGGNKATPQYEITMKFEEWFYKQKEIIDDILPDLELHKWENKFITQLEDHMEVTFCD